MSTSVRQHGDDGEDARDLAAAAAGDHQAFARIYDRHGAVVFSLCRQCTGRFSIADADDACQETFIRAFQMLGRFRHNGTSESSVRAWLYAIARRVCAERRRSITRRSRHEETAMQLMQRALRQHQHSPTRGEDLATIISDEEQLDRLTVALNQLDERERLAIHLHYLDADPMTTAPQALGLSRSAYYKLLAAARDKLAALMHKVQPS